MSQTSQLIDTLKRELRKQRITYKQVAKSLDLSEASGWVPIKRAGRYHAAEAFENDQGQRIYVSRDGMGFLLTPLRDPQPVPEEWDRLMESALLTRSGT